jgi:hypothetical protein
MKMLEQNRSAIVFMNHLPGATEAADERVEPPQSATENVPRKVNFH